jgi:AraC-like DNA-binding protein/tetratricopeptide (TPR) repeat protein
MTRSTEMLAMLVQPLPHDVKKAIDLFRSDPARSWRIGDLARRCGVPRRTLEKHFRRFVGCAPLEFLHTERLDQARRKLLSAPPGASVTEIAAACGLNHFGRFAVVYRDRYGESPSETLRWRRIPASATSASFRLTASSERPALALLPFDLAGPVVPGGAEDISDAIGAALYRTGWIRIVPAPAGRYHLQGRVKDDGTGTLRIRLMLIDRSISRYVWADCLECAGGDLFRSQEWFANLVSGVLRSVLCDAEIDRAAGKDKMELTAWALSMRALPMVLAADPAAHATAIELLDRAIECAHRDPVPMSLAAWCHGLRAGHHFTTYPKLERDTALQLASQASGLGAGDPLSDTMLSAAYMLAHDLAFAAAHARRALAIDGGSSWGWGRLAWVHCYRGETAKAIECCRIARVLGLTDPLGFVWAIGIAAANFEEGRYTEAVQWYRRALAEQPKATWLNRFLAPALLLAGHRDGGRQSLHVLSCSFPELTISQVMTGLPHTPRFLGPIAEGLAGLGMPRA